MSVYLVAMVKVNDPETYKKYTARTPDIIQKHARSVSPMSPAYQNRDLRLFENFAAHV